MAEHRHCFVCGAFLNHPTKYQSDDAWTIDCPVCGHFVLTDTAKVMMDTWFSDEEGEKKRPLISHYINRRQQGVRLPLISSDQFKEQFKEAALPSVFEQADNLLRWLGDNTEDPGRGVDIRYEALVGVVGSVSEHGIKYCLKALEQKALVGLHSHAQGSNVRLTFAGWEHYGEIKRGSVSGTKAFMAMKFDDPVLDPILEQHFRPAVAATGFKLFRLDDEPRAGLIDDRLRLEIKSSRFLISDLTHENAGAYWEAGYAEGLGKPVIYTCEASKFEEHKTHFDTNHHLTVVWDKGKPEDAVEQLKATIRFTFPEAKQVDN